MTPRVLYEQSDFQSPDETCAQWHHRTHPAPVRPVDRVAVALIAVGGAASFLFAVWVAFLLLVIA
jgi:hypothetical protein